MKLVSPSLDYQLSYYSYIEELGDEERYPYPLDLEYQNFSRLITLLNDYSNGINLPNWLVPNSTYWLVDGNDIVGCSHLRHRLNAQLELAGGHIGLGVRPSARGQGIGRTLMNLTLEKAKHKGINPVHIHCYSSNEASKKLIESVGSTLSSTYTDERSAQEVLRYQFHF